MLHRIGSDLRGPLLNVDYCLMSVNIEFLTECFVTYIAGVSIGFCWLFCIHYFSLFIFSFKTFFFFFIFSPWMLTMRLEKRLSFLNVSLHNIQVNLAILVNQEVSILYEIAQCDPLIHFWMKKTDGQCSHSNASSSANRFSCWLSYDISSRSLSFLLVH